MSKDIFKINGFAEIGVLAGRLNELLASGKSPYVEIKGESIDRSQAQNKTMHMWFKEISKSTGSDVIEEAGRCKFLYFLPILGMSENDESRFAAELLRMIYKQRGYEYLVQALGRSMIESTRLLTVKEFEQALTSMRAGEAMHNLTDPSLYMGK